VAVVRVGDDRAGGWFAGSLVAEATEDDAALLRRSQLSGEWQTMWDGWWEAHQVDPGAGVELRALCAVATGKAVLMRRYRGFLPTLARADADWIEQHDQRFRDELRAVLDENAPPRAVDIIRRALDDLDRTALRRRVKALREPPPLPIPSLTNRENSP
jgi:hypothetical protein